MLGMVSAKRMAQAPVIRVAKRAQISPVLSPRGSRRKGLTMSLTKEMDAELRKESAEDMRIASTPAIMKPRIPTGNAVWMTYGRDRLGLRPLFMVRATRPIPPEMAKKGIEKIPLQNVPRSMRVVSRLMKRVAACAKGAVAEEDAGPRALSAASGDGSD